MKVRPLGTGPTVRAYEYCCDARKGATPVAEAHRGFSVSYVQRGTFGVRSRGESFELVPGALLIGFPGDEYTCTHHRDGGDECLSFQLDEADVDAIGGGDGAWRACALPPLAELVVLGELARSVAHGDSDVGVDEVGLALAARMTRVTSGRRRKAQAPSAADRKRALDAAAFIDAHVAEEIDLERTARAVGLGSFHFLRLFANVVGVTPHQYLVRARLRRAAEALAQESSPIIDVALRVGFGDVSNFVRTFRRAAGVSPREFRRAAKGDRKILQERLSAAP